MVEKGRGTTIKILHRDRDREYTSQEFVSFCEAHGIQSKLIRCTKWRFKKKLKYGVDYFGKNWGPISFWPEAVTGAFRY